MKRLWPKKKRASSRLNEEERIFYGCWKCLYIYFFSEKGCLGCVYTHTHSDSAIKMLCRIIFLVVFMSFLWLFSLHFFASHKLKALALSLDSVSSAIKIVETWECSSLPLALTGTHLDMHTCDAGFLNGLELAAKGSPDSDADMYF